MDREAIISVIFPRRCAACGAMLRAGAVCEPCFKTIAVLRAPFAGRSFFIAGGSGAPAFPYFIGAAASYGTPALAALIHALKFRGIRAAAEPIADLLAAYALPFRRRLAGYAVLAVPLSRARLRMRGFNQAELIAASFARRLALPRAPADAIVRPRHAAPQTETTGFAERMANVRGCFASPRAAAAAARGGRFILIDDVTTTGATLLEAARALASARAAHVIALAAAKA